MKSAINIAIIGCGMRGRSVISAFYRELGDKLKIHAVYDPDPESVKRLSERLKITLPETSPSMEAAVNHPEVDRVMIFTPNALHCEEILAALAAGKQVFSEKPLATTLEDCKKIVAAEKSAGISIDTGFVLRYSPIYRKVKELLDSGTFGRIINIAASENRESYGGGHSMCADYGWRRLRRMAGPYLLEKCSHDLDLLNWYIGAPPLRTAAFCGTNYFIPENDYIWDKYKHSNFDSIVLPGHCINPFHSEKDIYDNHTIIYDYPNGVKVNFQLTLANAIPERRMYISCTEGTIICECFSGMLTYKHYDDPVQVTLHFGGGGHGGGDSVMAKELSDSWLAEKPLSISGSANGLVCARAALAADESARSGRIVDLKEFE